MSARFLSTSSRCLVRSKTISVKPDRYSAALANREKEELVKLTESLSPSAFLLETDAIPTSKSADWFEGRSSVPKWMQAKQRASDRAQGIFEEPAVALDSTLALITHTLQQEKAIDLVVIDMHDKSLTTDYMVICEGRNIKHVYALADAVRMLFKHSYTPSEFMPDTLTICGDDTEWMTVDTGRVIVHSFMPETRKEYDLEGLWGGIKDQFIIDARGGFANKAASARRIKEDVKLGMENQFKISLNRLEGSDLISEEEIKNDMR